MGSRKLLTQRKKYPRRSATVKFSSAPALKILLTDNFKKKYTIINQNNHLSGNEKVEDNVDHMISNFRNECEKKQEKEMKKEKGKEMKEPEKNVEDDEEEKERDDQQQQQMSVIENNEQKEEKEKEDELIVDFNCEKVDTTKSNKEKQGTKINTELSGYVEITTEDDIEEENKPNKDEDKGRKGSSLDKTENTTNCTNIKNYDETTMKEIQECLDAMCEIAIATSQIGEKSQRTTDDNMRRDTCLDKPVLAEQSSFLQKSEPEMDPKEKKKILKPTVDPKKIQTFVRIKEYEEDSNEEECEDVFEDVTDKMEKEPDTQSEYPMQKKGEKEESPDSKENNSNTNHVIEQYQEEAGQIKVCNKQKKAQKDKNENRENNEEQIKIIKCVTNAEKSSNESKNNVRRKEKRLSEDQPHEKRKDISLISNTKNESKDSKSEQKTDFIDFYNDPQEWMETRKKLQRLDPQKGREDLYGPTGIRNIGSSCFISASMQCLSHIGELIKGMLEEGNRNKNPNSILKQVSLMMMALRSGEYSSISPKELKNAIGIKTQAYEKGQQDAHEFLLYLIQMIKEEAKEYQMDSIEKMFEGKEKTSVRCENCDYLGESEQVYNIIPLSIPNKLTDIREALKEYETEEKVSEWWCDQCKKNGKALQKVELSTVPETLIIQLKRFRYDEKSKTKNNAMIEYPLEALEIKTSEKTSQFDLKSVIYHHGTYDGGHYTARCRNEVTEAWYDYDDHKVNEIEESKIVSRSAYILFYEKVVGELDTPNNYKSIEDKEDHIRRSDRNRKPSDKLKMKDILEETEMKKKIEKKTYCICKAEDNGELMMNCQNCEDWYHPKCVTYMCEKCTIKTNKDNKKLHDLEMEEERLRDELQKSRSVNRQLKEEIKNKDLEKKKIRIIEAENNKLKRSAEKKDHETERKEKIGMKNEDNKKRELEKKHKEEIEQSNKELKKREDEINQLIDEAKEKERCIELQKDEIETLTKEILLNSLKSNNMRTRHIEEVATLTTEIKQLKSSNEDSVHEMNDIGDIGLLERNKHLEKKVKDQDTIEKKLNKEVEDLKIENTAFTERLETALSELSQKEKEVIHLCYNMDNLKNATKELALAMAEEPDEGINLWHENMEKGSDEIDDIAYSETEETEEDNEQEETEEDDGRNKIDGDDEQEKVDGDDPKGKGGDEELKELEGYGEVKEIGDEELKRIEQEDEPKGIVTDNEVKENSHGKEQNKDDTLEKKKKCRYGDDCRRQMCRFWHEKGSQENGKGDKATEEKDKGNEIRPGRSNERTRRKNNKDSQEKEEKYDKDDKQEHKNKCWFGDNCRRIVCNFWHENTTKGQGSVTKAIGKEDKVEEMPRRNELQNKGIENQLEQKQQEKGKSHPNENDQNTSLEKNCKYGDNCWRKICYYKHPSKDTDKGNNEERKRTKGKDDGRRISGRPTCWYGKECANENCPYYHDEHHRRQEKSGRQGKKMEDSKNGQKGMQAQMHSLEQKMEKKLNSMMLEVKKLLQMRKD